MESTAVALGFWGTPQQHTGMLTGVRMGRALNPAAFLQDSTAVPHPTTSTLLLCTSTHTLGPFG